MFIHFYFIEKFIYDIIVVSIACEVSKSVLVLLPARKCAKTIFNFTGLILDIDYD